MTRHRLMELTGAGAWEEVELGELGLLGWWGWDLLRRRHGGFASPTVRGADRGDRLELLWPAMAASLGAAEAGGRRLAGARGRGCSGPAEQARETELGVSCGE